eukprot:CAMPEP_0172520960 /NCGR_PEP_ID=MMETSP1066-20121228/292298_1 /TAXON_ID=671091 /ORGANISM="Coscinodiscus wailesii, Strain CCMP2513" /LENGTH=471 /DNA_ID=CAMNT_0013303787 /DNA_START=68 /DNA_END=1483 /DNA_ORIENTATION=-
MTLPHRREPSSTPALRPHTSLHRTPATTESNTSSKTNLLENAFPNQKQEKCSQDHCTESNTSSETSLLKNAFPNLEIYSAYERHFIYCLLYYVREIDAITAHLPSPFTISPSFGPLSFSIARNKTNTIISYNLDSNRPANSFSLNFKSDHLQKSPEIISPEGSSQIHNIISLERKPQHDNEKIEFDQPVTTCTHSAMTGQILSSVDYKVNETELDKCGNSQLTTCSDLETDAFHDKETYSNSSALTVVTDDATTPQDGSPCSADIEEVRQTEASANVLSIDKNETITHERRRYSETDIQAGCNGNVLDKPPAGATLQNNKPKLDNEDLKKCETDLDHKNKLSQCTDDHVESTAPWRNDTENCNGDCSPKCLSPQKDEPTSHGSNRILETYPENPAAGAHNEFDATPLQKRPRAPITPTAGNPEEGVTETPSDGTMTVTPTGPAPGTTSAETPNTYLPIIPDSCQYNVSENK